ncbi:MAG: hypothetical protein DCC75_13935, partial [Proteobacteria bacterium]
ASEARLASLVAVAKGQVSHQHWFMLNRSLTDSAGGKALLSWSATMFEYLMPLLVMRDFAGTLLSDTYRAVVKAQQVYGRKRGVPWGVSESAYSGVDFEKTYQYRAFGVPGLGLKRGLSDDLVISPYSTFLALPVSPKGCISNVRRLEKLGVRGEYGFYEAVDFTQDRLSAEEKFHIVKSFLAHHQGMSLVSINNYLNDNIVQKRFHSDPSIKSCDLLLQERFPSKIPVLVPHQAELLALEQEELEMRAERSERIKTPFSATPRARVISNGRYTVMLDSAGAGTSMLDGDLTLTRWREDSISNMSGHFIYLRDLESGRFWSSAYLPSQVEPDDYEVFFNPDKIEYRRRDHSIALHTEVTVSPEDNVEIRNLTVTNLSGRLRELEVTSYGEVALAPRRADLAHQAFSKLFISSEYLSDYDALIFMRRKRSEKEKPLFMAHMISMPIVWAPVQYETNRANFLGRGRRACNPAAFDTFAPLTKSVGTVLDPVFALRTKVEVDPGASQTVTFITLIAEGRDELINLIKKYHERHNIT